MELLLDTHALLWWFSGDEAPSTEARRAIADVSNGIFVSAASVWEIATNHRLGKLSIAPKIMADIEESIASQGFTGFSISVRHGQTAGALPGPHRDPFARMLIAQAIIEGFVLVSNERSFDSYGVRRLW